MCVFKNECIVFHKKYNKGIFCSKTQQYTPYGFGNKQDGAALDIFGGVGAGPPKGGFFTPTNTTLKPGTKVDRYGG
ncbi:hypothetical protein, partial [Enterobacter hormaechei]